MLSQDEARGIFATQTGLNRLSSRLVSAAFNDPEVERRYTALTEWEQSTAAEEPDFSDPTTREVLNLSTRTRNRVYP